MALTTMYHRSATMELLGKIKTIRQNYDASQLHQLFNSLNLNSFVKIDCEDIIPRNENQFYKNECFLIANLSDMQAQLFVKNSKGDLIGERKLDQGEYSIFMETDMEFWAIDTDYFSIIELHQNDQCIHKYVEKRNGYLIIE